VYHIVIKLLLCFVCRTLQKNGEMYSTSVQRFISVVLSYMGV